ncbi:MAG: hypothetical protein K5681_10055 [Treponema sp.]|nr:hypothetical protein [Treponema sp.]
MIDFNANPFFLKKEEIDWVNQTYEKMTLRERIGQLFCPILFTKDEKELEDFLKKYAPGGILYRECSGQELLKAHRFLQEKSKIPLLTASNLETGGNGSASEATYFGRQMLVAASGNLECARDYAKVCCSEGRALGVNWAFAPVCDIDRNYHNPIINVRSFGNNSDTVCKMSLEYLKAAKEEGIACAPKHFPGDGIDERDQHLLTSVNSLSREEWDSTYGKIYQTLIDEGTLTIMAGHIALPCYESQKDKIVPATLSKALLKIF